MAQVIDTADMKQRVATTEAKLGAALQEELMRNPRLLGLLQEVEKTLVLNQQQIRRLEEERAEAGQKIDALLEEMAELQAQIDTSPAKSRPLKLLAGALEAVEKATAAIARKNLTPRPCVNGALGAKNAPAKALDVGWAAAYQIANLEGQLRNRDEAIAKLEAQLVALRGEGESSRSMLVCEDQADEVFAEKVPLGYQLDYRRWL